jgi:hypothetical protein
MMSFVQLCLADRGTAAKCNVTTRQVRPKLFRSHDAVKNQPVFEKFRVIFSREKRFVKKCFGKP